MRERAPRLYRRLRAEGKLEDILRRVQERGAEQEASVLQASLEETPPPEDPLERTQHINRLAASIREIALSQLLEEVPDESAEREE